MFLLERLPLATLSNTVLWHTIRTVHLAFASPSHHSCLPSHNTCQSVQSSLYLDKWYLHYHIRCNKPRGSQRRSWAIDFMDYIIDIILWEFNGFYCLSIVICRRFLSHHICPFLSLIDHVRSCISWSWYSNFDTCYAMPWQIRWVTPLCESVD